MRASLPCRHGLHSVAVWPPDKRGRWQLHRQPRCARRSALGNGITLGFTLLEMLVVIILIGIAVTAVAVSVSQGLASARVNAACGELSAALQRTRTAAIVSGQERSFELNWRQGIYRSGQHAAQRLPPGVVSSIVSAQEDKVNADTGRIRFFPDGSSTGGRIVLRHGRRQWHIDVSWLTGVVSVVDATVRQ